MKCDNCERTDCPTLTMPRLDSDPRYRSLWSTRQRNEEQACNDARADCRAHTVNWRERALAAEAKLASAADAALDRALKAAAEEAYREAWVEGACERVCDCKTCNMSPEDAYKSSDTRKKWAKEDK